MKALFKIAVLVAAILLPGVAMAATFSFGASTATGTSGASTCANTTCVVTTESLSTAAGATFSEAVTAPVLATDVCFASVTTAGTGTPVVTKVTPAAGTLTIVVQNIHASAAFNNTLNIAYTCFR
jgi:hypothetical protein